MNDNTKTDIKLSFIFNYPSKSIVTSEISSPTNKNFPISFDDT